MPEIKIKVGDVVTLKGGGPKMTVTLVWPDGRLMTSHEESGKIVHLTAAPAVFRRVPDET